MKLKIAIVVHGRFYAFDLVRELINQGHDVTLLTNYPKHIVEKFGIPKDYVRSFLFHGVLSRSILFLQKFIKMQRYENFTHSYFSQWASHKLQKDKYHVVKVFSGIAEEIFISLSNTNILKLLVRGSAHICLQNQILTEESNRAKVPVDKPSAWMIAREEREYQLSDAVIVLSTFAKKSFIQQGFPLNKLSVLPLGAQLSVFRPEKQVIEERCQRILSNQPLRILMVGTFSLRKGAIDLVKIAALNDSSCRFRFVGSIAEDAQHLVSTYAQKIEFISKQLEFELPLFYAWADVFIFTTIEDGYAVVLSQAQASGLPIIATSNCSGPDIVKEGQTGWILPIRSPELFVDRLRWCDTHRNELAQMVRRVYEDFQPRDWREVAADFANICTALLNEKTHNQSNGK